MEFSYGFTTVRHAHFHMQANRIDFSWFAFNASSFTPKCARLHSLTRLTLHNTYNCLHFALRTENKLCFSSMIFTWFPSRQFIHFITDINVSNQRKILQFCPHLNGYSKREMSIEILLRWFIFNAFGFNLNVTYYVDGIHCFLSLSHIHWVDCSILRWSTKYQTSWLNIEAIFNLILNYVSHSLRFGFVVNSRIEKYRCNKWHSIPQNNFVFCG